MEKLLATTMLLMLSIIAYAQEDVTRFLGIPVDGSKTAMIRRLEEWKGFQYDPTDDVLVGEFNGTKVEVSVVTNNNKVCRIALVDAYPSNECDIKIRFNRLCWQFANNPKYITLTLDDFTIPEDEDISYEIAVHSKRYQAVFYQRPAEIDTVAIAEKLQSTLLSKYTEEQLRELSANPTVEFLFEILHLADELMGFSKRHVWFMIDEDYYGQYRILMYYDNGYNQANGEDL